MHLMLLAGGNIGSLETKEMSNKLMVSWRLQLQLMIAYEFHSKTVKKISSINCFALHISANTTAHIAPCHQSWKKRKQNYLSAPEFRGICQAISLKPRDISRSSTCQRQQQRQSSRAVQIYLRNIEPIIKCSSFLFFADEEEEETWAKCRSHGAYVKQKEQKPRKKICATPKHKA